MRTVCLALALTGCSIIGTKSVTEVGAEKCTASPGYAAADTVVVAGAGAFAVYSAIELEDVDHLAIPAAVGVAVIWGISAIVGYSRVTRCKRARIKEGIAY